MREPRRAGCGGKLLSESCGRECSLALSPLPVRALNSSNTGVSQEAVFALVVVEFMCRVDDALSQTCGSMLGEGEGSK